MDMNTHPIPTANRRSQRSAAWYATQIGNAYRQAAAYEKMLALATELGLEYEIERMTESINEMGAEVDYLIEQAILAGFSYEDIEAAS